MWLLDEETGEPVEVPLAAVAPEMTPEHVAMPPESVGDRATESLCDKVRDTCTESVVVVCCKETVGSMLEHVNVGCCAIMPLVLLACRLLCRQAVGRPLRTHGRRRRRQLVFVDPEVQIPDKEIQQQVEDPLTETLNMVHDIYMNILFTALAQFKKMF